MSGQEVGKWSGSRIPMGRRKHGESLVKPHTNVIIYDAVQVTLEGPTLGRRGCREWETNRYAMQREPGYKVSGDWEDTRVRELWRGEREQARERQLP